MGWRVSWPRICVGSDAYAWVCWWNGEVSGFLMGVKGKHGGCHAYASLPTHMRGYVGGATHMRRKLRICVGGVRFVCSKGGWARWVTHMRLLMSFVEVPGWVRKVSSTHMRGGYTYAWGAKVCFKRLRLSCLDSPRLSCSGPSQYL
ncbi:hypothetical protein PIB30_073864, partial [Stylosanthes scabra]|nr:hypothetical protein [Stylosanthes scabra]